MTTTAASASRPLRLCSPRQTQDREPSISSSVAATMSWGPAAIRTERPWSTPRRPFLALDGGCWNQKDSIGDPTTAAHRGTPMHLAFQSADGKFSTDASSHQRCEIPCFRDTHGHGQLRSHRQVPSYRDSKAHGSRQHASGYPDSDQAADLEGRILGSSQSLVPCQGPSLAASMMHGRVRRGRDMVQSFEAKLV